MVDESDPLEFDVFLSYARWDQGMATRLGKLLEERGLRVWLDEWKLLPGDLWQEVVEEAILKAPCAAILVGEKGLGAWHTREARAFISRATQEGLRVIPVLLPKAAVSTRLSVFLEEHHWSDLRCGFKRAGIDLLEQGIRCAPKSRSGIGPRDDRLDSTADQGLDGSIRSSNRRVSGSSRLFQKLDARLLGGGLFLTIFVLVLLFSLSGRWIRSFSKDVTTGTIQDLAGDPVVGAVVHIPLLKTTTTTDENGSFELAHEADEERFVELTARKEGFEFHRRHVRLGGPPVTFQMMRR